ncbi:MAG: RecX family transcriptional regulator [Anaerovorax sp.]
MTEKSKSKKNTGSVSKKTTKTIEEIAFHYASSRYRSTYEMQKYLQKQGFCQDEIDRILWNFTENQYLDDDRYCEAYVFAETNKGYATARIKMGLAKKGVCPHVVERVLEEQDLKSKEKEKAEEEAERTLRKAGFTAEHVDEEGLDEEEQEGVTILPLGYKLKGKIARRLATLGYGGEIICSVLQNIKTVKKIEKW